MLLEPSYGKKPNTLFGQSVVISPTPHLAHARIAVSHPTSRTHALLVHTPLPLLVPVPLLLTHLVTMHLISSYRPIFLCWFFLVSRLLKVWSVQNLVLNFLSVLSFFLDDLIHFHDFKHLMILKFLSLARVLSLDLHIQLPIRHLCLGIPRTLGPFDIQDRLPLDSPHPQLAEFIHLLVEWTFIILFSNATR